MIELYHKQIYNFINNLIRQIFFKIISSTFETQLLGFSFFYFEHEFFSFF